MRSYLALGLIAVCGFCLAVAEPQQNYDGRNGPQVFGPPGQQVYIRGQNDGPYNVPGVGGTFQNSPKRGEHVYTDERGNTYVNQKSEAGKPGTHTINGPDFVAQNGKPGGSNIVYTGPDGSLSATRSDGRTVNIPGRGRRGVVHVSRPDRTVTYGQGGAIINRNRRDSFHVGRPDRTVDFSTGPSGSGFSINRNRRDSFHVSRPDRTVTYGQGGAIITRNRRDFHVSRPDRTVTYGQGGAIITRNRRDLHVSRPDRTVTYGQGGAIISRNRRDSFHVSRPDRTVDFSTGSGDGYSIQRGRRSPQVGHVSRPDGRSVDYSPDGVLARGSDGRTVGLSYRYRRDISDARVTGENFAARGDRAGVWNGDGVSVWKRPDGRTVTTDANGNVITSGSPNGRGPQFYSG